ncbi:unnamed protein product [Chrysodeixis includens]|uniref:Uncharacterized protein n=1 Tax=Chrysodeixis includens TaxID=689277 RepID=A0A9N8KXX9_CHRIL|nr:unnamed protein product [Chrysodeixis includens]
MLVLVRRSDVVTLFCPRIIAPSIFVRSPLTASHGPLARNSSSVRESDLNFTIDIFSHPSACKLEETPAASPAEPGPDEPPAPDDKAKLDTRRKSTSWKTFNLKRQLSKVDLKFKAAFAMPTENNLEEVVPEKGNSQFYCEANERTEAAPATTASTSASTPTPTPSATPAPESQPASPDSEETKPSSADEEGSGAGSSPLRVCSDVFERMHRELQDKRAPDVYERMHRELQERWQAEHAPARPDSLPLEGGARRAARARPAARPPAVRAQHQVPRAPRGPTRRARRLAGRPHAPLQ